MNDNYLINEDIDRFNFNISSLTFSVNDSEG
jgi:hypothetical protein